MCSAIGPSGPQRRRQDKSQLVLPNHITGAVLDARFRPGIGQALETEGCFVKVRGLLGVAHVKLDVVGPLQAGENQLRGGEGFCGAAMVVSIKRSLFPNR